MKHIAIIGIDLGTTNSLCTTWKDGECIFIPNALGEIFTPSVVSVDANGEILVGKIAKERKITQGNRTAFSFKQFMGSSKAYALGDTTFQPEDLSSLVIRQLFEDAKAFLGEEITEAIISVPAYFNNSQRSATRLSGELAGLFVERTINEPSAAAIAYQQGEEKNGTYMVFDFGGGTLDVSIVEIFENIVDIIAIAGDNHLGGDDIDEIIVDAFYKKYPKLKKKLTKTEHASLCRMAEQSKIALSSQEHVIMAFHHGNDVYDIALDNATMLEMCTPICLKIQEVLTHVLRDSKCKVDDIDDILLVGGSSRMPVVSKYIEYLMGKKPRMDIDPDKAVAIGVGMVTGIKARNEEIKDVVMTDVCPFSLGIKVQSSPLLNLPGEFSPIIERNTSLPVSRQGRYSTAQGGQSEILIEVFQGESRIAENNLRLGNIRVPVPILPQGEASVLVTFTYDINGILDVEVYSENDDKTVGEVFVTNKTLTKYEIARRLEKLSALKLSQREGGTNQLLIARAERLFEENTGMEREWISQNLNSFLLVTATGKHMTEMKKAQINFQEFLDSLERNAFEFFPKQDGEE